eukprot:m.353493 g.353493  ORF g.353493 m.353493 type:complete len:272 (-) comp16776_c0_seq1:167-982(-)
MARLLSAMGWLGSVVAAAGVVANTSLYNVEGGHRAVMFDQLRGVSQVVRGEGTHFKIPLLQTPHIYDCRSQYKNLPVATPSKDLQTVSVTLRILYRPQVAELPTIFTSYGMDYAERIIPSIANEVLKAVVAQHDASELITQREVVSKKVRDALTRRAKDFHLVLDDISLTHLQFGREYATAVELKQVAQQEAERAKFVVEKAEQEKIANIIRAEGDSEAAKLVSQALAKHGTGLIELRKIEAARDIADTMSRSRNVAYLPGGNNVLMNLQV